MNSSESFDPFVQSKITRHNPAVELGQFVREHRNALGLRLVDIGEAVGVSLQHVSSIELGGDKISDERLQDFADALQLEGDEPSELARLNAQWVNPTERRFREIEGRLAELERRLGRLEPE